MKGKVSKKLGPKKLKNGGKPKGHTSNTTDQHVPRGHDMCGAATMHLIRCKIERVTYGPKNLSSFMVVMTCHDDHRIQGQLMGLTKSTKDEAIL